MNPVIKEEIRDFKAEIIKKKNRYVTRSIEFKLKILKERGKASDLRRKRK